MNSSVRRSGEDEQGSAESFRIRPVGRDQRQHLEQGSHLVRSGQTILRHRDLGRARRLRCRKRRGAGGEAEPFEPFALPGRASHFQSGCAPFTRQGGEIDMRGQIAFAGIGEGIGIVMAAHRLQRIARGRPLMTVINNDRGTALIGDPRRKFGADRARGRAAFDDRVQGGTGLVAAGGVGRCR